MAFHDAFSLGYRYFETDVQVTADGTLVAFHDDNLLRTCGIDKNIHSMRSSEVRQARIDGREPIPLLSELLEEFPDVSFNIDAKSDATLDPLIDTLKNTDCLDRVCIGSFDHRRLVRLRQALGTQLCTSASPREVARWMLGAAIPDVSCVQIPLRHSVLRVVTPGRIARSDAVGLPVHVWTIDDPDTIQDMIDIGVHGIMTDDASTLKRLAEKNSLWA